MCSTVVIRDSFPSALHGAGCYCFKEGEVRGERLSRVPCPQPEPEMLLSADIQVVGAAERDPCLGASPVMHEVF